MDPLTMALLVSLATVAMLAVTALLVTRAALKGTDSQRRAEVLRAVAEIIRAIRGKK
ncbi:hypothetical protein ACFY5F_50890 [Streptomyces sp. NPDC013161]|uniref:hypothetical protein n=1 Tax=Streptomyces sp. NPDC013161 TaxID=3364862 RepID=UPI0036B78D78